MYDKYTVRLRVKWTADSQPKAATSHSLGNGAPRLLLEGPLLGMLNQVRQVLELQDKLTARATAAEASSAERAVLAEARAKQAEERAKAAEAALAAICHAPGPAPGASREGSPAGIQGLPEDSLPEMSLREISGL
ncbi:U2AF35A [Symbiodinium sp. CCMP2592]|nr:U2AF35A [Symbiodinium sp. CCMP2592]